GELRGAAPEQFVVVTMTGLGASDLLNPIQPVLRGLILRHPACQHYIDDALCPSILARRQRELTRQNNGTGLPASSFFMLRYVRARNNSPMCPVSSIFKSNSIAHLTKSQSAAIG